MRQVGTRIHPGANVGIGRDWTLFALIDGIVQYERSGKDRRRVRIEPAAPSRRRPDVAAGHRRAQRTVMQPRGLLSCSLPLR